MKKTIILLILIYFNFTNIYAQIINYQYDNLNRLTNVNYGNGTIISYTYDDLGNRIGLIIQGSVLPPNIPSNVSIEISNNNVIISWDEATGASYYSIYASDDPVGHFINVSSSGTFGTATRNTSVTKLSSSRKQKTTTISDAPLIKQNSSLKQKRTTMKKVSDKNRNQLTWTSDISGNTKKFYYVTAVN